MSEVKREGRGRPIADPVAPAVYAVLAGITVLCVFLIMVRLSIFRNESFRFMLWNLFLAWLPLIVSYAALQLAQSRRGPVRAVLLSGLGIGWLLLYPNAPYLTTDFIHLIFRRYHLESLVLWYDLVVFFLFSWCGLLIGYVSMRHFQVMISHAANAAAGWLFVAGSSFLGGFGIYLGRVIRLNSWDAFFNPFRLIEGILEGLNPGAFIFTGLFGVLILILYVSLYVLRNSA